jgi:hypothetical protein
LDKCHLPERGALPLEVGGQAGGPGHFHQIRRPFRHPLAHVGGQTGQVAAGEAGQVVRGRGRERPAAQPRNGVLGGLLLQYPLPWG